ncbi:hypothetical protein DICVIV_12573 [Dictyocaulus viviparus]|uniref:Uncharacterized protein n=1 Tax=Dictyocaulus viviparus TaxID=29172 RepID=A0A0D8XGE4_DICVI|nr:hypothetical protein DICVIV_12573 [Dictyocaulus viviparus]
MRCLQLDKESIVYAIVDGGHIFYSSWFDKVDLANSERTKTMRRPSQLT